MKNITTFEEHLEKRHGKIGTETRTQFDIKSKAFAIGEILKEARSAAFALIKDDPSLKKPDNVEVKNHFQKHYQYLLKNLNTA